MLVLEETGAIDVSSITPFYPSFRPIPKANGKNAAIGH